jgi:hypothetical protein
MSIITVNQLAHSLSQQTLAFDNRLHQLNRCGQWQRRWWLFLIPNTMTTTKIVRHLQNA